MADSENDPYSLRSILKRWSPQGDGTNGNTEKYAAQATAYANESLGQLRQFGQQMGFGQHQAPPNQVQQAPLSPLNVTPPLSRPGDKAIEALARLYPGFSQ